jgi:hypothetical protein
MTSMSQYNYVAEYVDISELVRGPKGALRLDARAAYKEGWAMLSVYAFWQEKVMAGKRGLVQRALLQRVFVPSNMSKADKRNTLRAMCDLFAVQHGESYYLRSKLK